MKILLFDLLNSQPLGRTKFHGGGEYIKRVFSKLVIEYSNKIKVMAFYNFNSFIDDWIKELINRYDIFAINVHDISEIKSLFSKYHIDVFYTGLPYEYRKDMFPDNVYKVATFHGMRAVECPHDEFEFKYLDVFSYKMKEHVRNVLKDTKWGYSHNTETGIINYKKCIESFDKIVCVSNHTKYSLLNYYPELEPCQLSVMYSPLKVCTPAGLDKSKKRKYGEYILLLGANRWIKNVYRGIKAIEDLYSRGHLKNINTVVVGGLSKTIQNEIVNKDKFILLNYVSSKELEALYDECELFLYPTLNEGFGYPPLEAMAYGKTCVVSAVCSLPEICGDVVYYVNPFDIGEIQNRIIHALLEPINPNEIFEQYHHVKKRQEQDLKGLCDMITRI